MSDIEVPRRRIRLGAARAAVSQERDVGSGIVLSADGLVLTVRISLDLAVPQATGNIGVGCSIPVDAATPLIERSTHG